MTKVLFVSRAVPYANGRGIERRAALHLSYLTQLGAVTLVVPVESVIDASNAGFRPDNLKVDRLIIRQDATQAEVSVSNYVNAANIVSKFWYGLRLRYWIDQTALPADSQRYQAAFGGDYDLLFAFRLSSAVWANSIFPPESTLPLIRVVDFDDLESQAFQRSRVGTSRSPTRCYTDWRSHNWLMRTERAVASTWTKTVVCSSIDAAQVRKISGNNPLILPNSVKFADPIPQHSASPHEVLFVGTLNYPPNVEGLKWFLYRVWPRVSQELQASVKLKVVGIDATADLVAILARAGACFLGRVETIEDEYVKCAVAIAPIFSGGGTRIKIIEAFSFTRAMLTTSVGCEGLDLVPGRDAIVADTPQEFSSNLITLIRDPQLRQRVAEAGWHFGKQRFSIDSVRAQARDEIAALMAWR
jgi:glycosyltransferase involved in cell wall biosynthesis